MSSWNWELSVGNGTLFNGDFDKFPVFQSISGLQALKYICSLVLHLYPV